MDSIVNKRKVRSISGIRPRKKINQKGMNDYDVAKLSNNSAGNSIASNVHGAKISNSNNNETSTSNANLNQNKVNNNIKTPNNSSLYKKSRFETINKKNDTLNKVKQKHNQKNDGTYFTLKNAGNAGKDSIEKIEKTERKKNSKSNHNLFIVHVIITVIISVILLLLGFFAYRFFASAEYNSEQSAYDGLSSDSTEVKKKHSTIYNLAQFAKIGDESKLRGYKDGRINILLLGIANTEKPGALLTDTIMLASVNVKDHKLSLLSIPRDLLVPYNGTYKKINSIYSIGKLSGKGAYEIKKVITNITRQEIHYYVVLDFKGFEEIIDALGGINVDVPRTIHDTKYPGPGYSYETFHIDKGMQHINGKTALKYARSRHDDPESDFGRAKRQQQVLQAIKNKAFSLGTVTNPFKISDILKTIYKHLDMDINSSEIVSFVTLADNLDTQNIETVILDAWKPDSLLVSVRKGNLPGLMPKSGDWYDIQELSKNIFDKSSILKRKQQIIEEKPKVLIVSNKRYDAVSNIVDNLRNKGFNDVVVAVRENLIQGDITKIIDKSNKSKVFSLDELLAQLNAEVLENFDLESIKLAEDSNKYDFIILVGKDAIDKYSFESLTKDEFDMIKTQVDEK